MKQLVLTWVLSVASACIIGAAWIHTHPVQKFVTVDIASLFTESAAAFAQRQDESALRLAQAHAVKIDLVLQQLADTCSCLVMNAAAIAKRPQDHQGRVAVKDMTDWVRGRIEVD